MNAGQHQPPRRGSRAGRHDHIKFKVARALAVAKAQLACSVAEHQLADGRKAQRRVAGKPT